MIWNDRGIFDKRKLMYKQKIRRVDKLYETVSLVRR